MSTEQELLELRQKVDLLQRRLDELSSKSAIMQLADRLRINQRVDFAGNTYTAGTITGENINVNQDVYCSSLRPSFHLYIGGSGHISVNGSTPPAISTNDQFKLHSAYGMPNGVTFQGGYARRFGMANPDDILRNMPWGNFWGSMISKPATGPQVPSMAFSGADLSISGTTPSGEHSQPVTNGLYRNWIGFDGTGNYIYRTNVSDVVVSNNFMIFGGWVYIAIINRNSGLMTLGHITPLANIHINSSNQIIVTAWNTSQVPTAVSSVPATVGWHFIGGHLKWYSSADYELSVFVDGTKNVYSGAALSSAFRTPNGNFRIGTDFNGYYFPGWLHRFFVSYSGGHHAALQDYYHASRPNFN